MIYSIRINNFSYLLFLVLFFSYCGKKDKKIVKVKIEYDSSKYIYKGVILFSKKQSNFIASIEKKHKGIVYYDCNGTVNTLYIEEFNESKLTDDIYSLRHLEFLRIESMYLKKFPDLEKNFSTLKELHLNGYGYNKNSLGKIIISPNLRNLETLKITGFDIDEIIFPNNSRIKNLIIGNCKLNKFPKTVCDLRYLEKIQIYPDNKFNTINFDVDSLAVNISLYYIDAFTPQLQKEVNEKIKQKQKKDGIIL